MRWNPVFTSFIYWADIYWLRTSYLLLWGNIYQVLLTGKLPGANIGGTYCFMCPTPLLFRTLQLFFLDLPLSPVYQYGSQKLPFFGHLIPTSGPQVMVIGLNILGFGAKRKLGWSLVNGWKLRWSLRELWRTMILVSWRKSIVKGKMKLAQWKTAETGDRLDAVLYLLHCFAFLRLGVHLSLGFHEYIPVSFKNSFFLLFPKSNLFYLALTLGHLMAPNFK